MIRISKTNMTVDIDEGAIEVKENIITNTGDVSLNDLVLAFDTENEIVFCTQLEISEAFLKLSEVEKLTCFSFEEINDFQDGFGVEIASLVMKNINIDAVRFFYSIIDAIWEAIEQTKDICNNYKCPLCLEGFLQEDDEETETETTVWYKDLRITAIADMSQKDENGNFWEGFIEKELEDGEVEDVEFGGSGLWATAEDAINYCKEVIDR